MAELLELEMNVDLVCTVVVRILFDCGMSAGHAECHTQELGRYAGDFFPANVRVFD